MNKNWPIIVACVLLAACATGARSERMIAGPQAENALPSDSPLRSAVEVADVSGGKETNPLWKSNISDEDFKAALIESVNAYAIGTETGAHYKLNAKLVEVKQPLAGINATVTSTVDYSLVDASSGDTVWEQKIENAYTAKFGDSIIGVERLKKANEGSIKGNIQQMLDALVAWNGQ